MKDNTPAIAATATAAAIALCACATASKPTIAKPFEVYGPHRPYCHQGVIVYKIGTRIVTSGEYNEHVRLYGYGPNKAGEYPITCCTKNYKTVCAAG